MHFLSCYYVITRFAHVFHFPPSLFVFPLAPYLFLHTLLYIALGLHLIVKANLFIGCWLLVKKGAGRKSVGRRRVFYEKREWRVHLKDLTAFKEK